ncbi:unnamed protein product [Closterium sp. NIES-64]|nr:unnamed protein product [Closterium sp. NIES-64]
MYSVHSYCGVLTLSLFAVQFVWGLCAFVLFKSRLSEATRYHMGTYHILLGKFTYYAGIGTWVVSVTPTGHRYHACCCTLRMLKPRGTRWVRAIGKLTYYAGIGLCVVSVATVPLVSMLAAAVLGTLILALAFSPCSVAGVVGDAEREEEREGWKGGNGFAVMQVVMVQVGQPHYGSASMAESWASLFLWLTSAAVFGAMTTSRTAELVTDSDEKDDGKRVAV